MLNCSCATGSVDRSNTLPLLSATPSATPSATLSTTPSATPSAAAPAHTMSPNAFKTVLDIDTMGAFNACRAAFEQLKASGEGSIVFVGAGQAFSPMMQQAHVGAAKAANDMLMKVCYVVHTYSSMSVYMFILCSVYIYRLCPVQLIQCEVFAILTHPITMPSQRRCPIATAHEEPRDGMGAVRYSLQHRVPRSHRRHRGHGPPRPAPRRPAFRPACIHDPRRAVRGKGRGGERGGVSCLAACDVHFGDGAEGGRGAELARDGGVHGDHGAVYGRAGGEEEEAVDDGGACWVVVVRMLLFFIVARCATRKQTDIRVYIGN